MPARATASGAPVVPVEEVRAKIADPQVLAAIRPRIGGH
jgi:hypothetical protein